MDKLGLAYYTETSKAHEQDDLPPDSVGIYISKDRRTLNHLLREENKTDRKERDQGMGKWLGTPQSAIDGWVNKEMLEQGEPPSEAKENPALAFVDFRLSRDHWREELESLEPRVREIKENFPELYKRMVKGAK